MVKKHAGYVVTLDEAIDEDKGGSVMDAILMIKGVCDVSPVTDDIGVHIAERQADHKWRMRVIDMLKGLFDDKERSTDG